MTSNAIHTGFLDRAARTPGAVAIAAPALTYGELLSRALRLAAAFRSAADLRHRRPIMIIGDKSPIAVEAILAASLTGLGYTYGIPRQRASRLSSMVEQLRPSLIVDVGSEEWDHNPEAIAHGLPVIKCPTVLPEDAIEPVLRPDGCAYTFFTSGSTGGPKGVVVSQSTAWHAQRAYIADVGLNSKDNVCSEMGLGFDVSTIDVFATLAVGATLDLTPDAVVEDPRALFHHLVERNITRLFTVPTVACQMLEIEPNAAEQLSHLNLSLTGELIPGRLAELLRPLIAQGRVSNQYGATEFPFGLSRRLTLADIARPNVIDNPTGGSPVSVRLSDLGDVTVTGPGLFSGYVLPQTDFTAPLHPVESFMTGDRAEPEAPGVLRLLGRSDSQCRKDGHRIELREIECAVELLADVGLCYATYDGKANHIIARVTAKGGETEHLDLTAVALHLKRVLPDYMLPARIEQLADAPRTLSGKKRYQGIAEARIVS
ncbi:MAG: AMP-binding protein [Hyphomicrobiaceae bacterium]